ncbi:aspartic-type endopeptidase [Ophiostoma piceae UAMH 11346]|uniref:Aspartic-type endopeptidase n=1 Tax=Ophiostoma piceae (strain UAMH 11346) TaxID=1262450 RepID=S3D8P5_OPHP1|nr:aspartic-type endopeptidase [Ophiostoma piceae UAMH 11346]
MEEITTRLRRPEMGADLSLHYFNHSLLLCTGPTMALPRPVLAALVSVVVLMPAFVVANDCAPEPLAVTIGNVTLSNNNVARGIEIAIGTPAQSFVFMPQWPLNNSFVYGNDGHCDTGVSSSKCTTFRGGAYNAIGSSTRKVPASGSYPADSAPWSALSFSADTLFLGLNSTSLASSSDDNTSTSLDNFAFGIPLNDLGQQGYHPMNALGLGFNSTLLNALKSTGRIASRSWSMFWGLNGADSTAQMDGVFVLGGYDAAKVVESQRYTQSLAGPGSACSSRMVVTITDMILNFSNGTNASIFPGAESTVLQACITPDFPTLMTLPTDPYFDAIEILTNASMNEQRSSGLVYYSNRYLPKELNVYTGDLTIKLQSGLEVRVPNNQLIVPDRYIDRTGVIQANATGLDTTILAIQGENAGDILQLGRQFLSVAYVMLNQDANEFTLWQANPTTNRHLVAVDERNADITSVCSSSGSGSGSNSTTPSGPSSARKPLSSGAIAGAAIGAFVGVAAIIAAVLLLLFWRRPRNHVVAATVAGAPTHRFHDPIQGVALMSPESSTPPIGSIVDDKKNTSGQYHEAYEMNTATVAHNGLTGMDGIVPRNAPHYEL